ncbi:SDR family oxidoreductase [Sinomonas sp. ASV486]|uniref:SDR family oxidoreductase n=1 Tax=Sinomonas sp. ASV486 TaxID=3051170 RepID=UPI0027DC079D|nr:SDR family oxidoreductase [Sinomonas sp. ASV486]MDQ4489781.1 SDR family oxidoreductase [Sinomonas sp. ASV486]
MKVFVTGASGWVGSAVVPELVAAGHEVTGFARSDASAAAVEAMGARVLRGDLDDLEALQEGALHSDGVVHLAFRHDFADFDAAVESDARAIGALGRALEGSGKPLVVTSGTPALAGQVATERDRSSGGLASGREANSDAALAFAARGVRPVVVRLPRSVHGQGDHGFVSRLIAIAGERGVAGFVGDGSARWPAVHVRDAARLYRLALEQAPAGSVLHAVGDEGVFTGDIASTIGAKLGLRVEPAAPETFGFLGALMGLDQPASSEQTRALLPWSPVEVGLLADLEAGHYFG